jgi:drug/metabolite transporter (DMT)-like permease
MMMWAGYTVLLRVKRDPLEVIELLCMVCAFGALFMTPWLVFEAISGVTLSLSKPGTLAVLYSAIGSLLLAYAGWSYVVARLGPARAGVTLHLMPAFGVVLSAVFLSEYPQWFHFAGIALILSGVALSAFRKRAAELTK